MVPVVTLYGGAGRLDLPRHRGGAVSDSAGQGDNGVDRRKASHRVVTVNPPTTVL